MGRLSDEYFELLSKEMIAQYLIANGWSTSFEGGNPAYDFFVNRSETGMEYVVSLRKASITPREIRSAVEGIAGFYMIKPDEAALMMTSQSISEADYIFCRLFEGQDVSSIPLSMARRVIDGGLDLIHASASSVFCNGSPSQYYARKSDKGAIYANECRLSHTSRGSFGFTFECPLPPLPAQRELFEDDQTIPDARKITRRIAIGVRSLADAVAADTCSVIVDGYESGLNGNMCEALLSIYEAAPHEKTMFSWKFSPMIKGDDALLPPQPIDGEKAIKCLDGALRQMKPMEADEAPEHVDLTGYVIRMESKDLYNNREGAKNEIMIEVSSGQYDGKNVKMSLDVERYIKAIAAHEHGEEVAVSGMVSKQGRSFVLSDIKHFTSASEKK